MLDQPATVGVRSVRINGVEYVEGVTARRLTQRHRNTLTALVERGVIRCWANGKHRNAKRYYALPDLIDYVQSETARAKALEEQRRREADLIARGVV